MTKTIPFLMSIILIFTVNNTLAQSIEEDSENDISTNSNRKYKNEIGIDLSAFKFVLSSSGGGYPSVFFRKHFTRERAVKGLSGINKTTYHAYRIRIGSNLSFNKVTPPDIRKIFYNGSNGVNYSTGYDYNNSTFFIRLGRERQIRSTKYELIYGYDIFFMYAQTTQMTIYSSVYNFSQTDQYYYNMNYGYKAKDNQFGIAGIGGFKYFLIPRLCFSAEATLNVGYSMGRRNDFYDRYDSQTDVLTQNNQKFSTSSLNISINPLFVINMGYYFK